MLRALLAFVTLGLAAFLLAPTVATVGQGIEALNIERELPWNLWKWDDTPPPEIILPPDCDYERKDTESEVTEWPKRITKNASFTIRGHVVETIDRDGVVGVEVDLFLNATKELPGEFLGTTSTGPGGLFSLEAKIPHDLDATKYHLVAHSKERTIGCRHFKESWSDPEMEVTSKTRVELDLPEKVLIGDNLTITGRVLDEVDGPVRKGNVTLTVEGEQHPLVTDETGAFTFTYPVEEPDNISVRADFNATKYYSASYDEGKVEVVPEDVKLADPEPLRFVRSTQREIVGHIRLAKGAQQGDLTVRFEGTRVVACEACEPTSRVSVTPTADGTFILKVVVPTTEEPGAFRIVVTGGGLQQEHPFNATLYVPVTLSLDARGAGFLTRNYEGTARAVDDAGEPVAGEVVVQGPSQAANGSLDAVGLFAFGGRARCGFHDVQAQFTGDGLHLPASAQTRMGVCGPLAYLPQWLLDTPLWMWPVALGLGILVLVFGRRLRERYAGTISRGPPLALAIAEPRDHAADVAGVGETVVVTAKLDDPLPDGHTLRLGTHRHMVSAAPGGDLSALHEIVPEKLGDLPVRGEIVDAKGRVVTRRTVHLRIVRYAEEIERSYRALKADHAGDELDIVSPREFESWLRERSPDLDPATARRLVALFEEADYGPREAGRDEFLAYLDAQKGVRGVGRHAA